MITRTTSSETAPPSRRALGVAALVATALALAVLLWPAGPEAARSVIVQGRDMEAAAAAVGQVGGTVTHELDVIDAVAAEVTPQQIGRLRTLAGRVYDNRPVEAVGKPVDDGGSTQLPVVRRVEADRLHALNIDGRGVTVAVIDTGHYSHVALNKNPDGRGRVLANYDAILDQESPYNPFLETDESGHGAHVASVILDSANLGTKREPVFRGLAPYADLVTVRAFDNDGRGTYADVIRGIGWIVQKADEHYIRVLTHRGADAVREARQVRSEFSLDDLALFAGVHELDRIFEADDVEVASLIEVIDHCGQRGRLAGTGRSRYEHHALVIVTKLLQDLRYVQFLERWHMCRDIAEHRAVPGDLAKHVDTKSATVFGGDIGKIQIVSVGQPLFLLGCQYLVNIAFEFSLG